eukprot:GHVT01061264.1.p1 GENE.GHVT01061264.1~~GHVT01061264.1.p1  ORF type:complete len:694 (-),score=50.34 GHVT01061264.1:868-2949(-)
MAIEDGAEVASPANTEVSTGTPQLFFRDGWLFWGCVAPTSGNSVGGTTHTLGEPTQSQFESAGRTSNSGLDCSPTGEVAAAVTTHGKSVSEAAYCPQGDGVMLRLCRLATDGRIMCVGWASGCWCRGFLTKAASSRFNDGTVDTGHFSFGRLHGQGHRSTHSGVEYDGHWRRGVVHGQGTLTINASRKAVQGPRNIVTKEKGKLVPEKHFISETFLDGWVRIPSNSERCNWINAQQLIGTYMMSKKFQSFEQRYPSFFDDTQRPHVSVAPATLMPLKLRAAIEVSGTAAGTGQIVSRMLPQNTCTLDVNDPVPLNASSSDDDSSQYSLPFLDLVDVDDLHGLRVALTSCLEHRMLIPVVIAAASKHDVLPPRTDVPEAHGEATICSSNVQIDAPLVDSSCGRGNLGSTSAASMAGFSCPAGQSLRSLIRRALTGSIAGTTGQPVPRGLCLQMSSLTEIAKSGGFWEAPTRRTVRAAWSSQQPLLVHFDLENLGCHSQRRTGNTLDHHSPVNTARSDPKAKAIDGGQTYGNLPHKVYSDRHRHVNKSRCTTCSTRMKPSERRLLPLNQNLEIPAAWSLCHFIADSTGMSTEIFDSNIFSACIPPGRVDHAAPPLHFPTTTASAVRPLREQLLSLPVLRRLNLIIVVSIVTPPIESQDDKDRASMRLVELLKHHLPLNRCGVVAVRLPAASNGKS